MSPQQTDYDAGYLNLLIGQLQGRVGALEEQNKQLLRIVERMSEDLAEVNETLSNATGGWRTLMAVGTVGAAIGGLVMSLIGVLRGG